MAQRKAAQSARRALSDKIRRMSNRAICDRLSALPILQNARVVMSYMAYAGEVDLAQIHEFLLRRGVQLCFPRCGAGNTMEALAPQDGENGWETDRFGIRTPKAACSEVIPPQAIDALLVPCVAFDKGCHRLGWGGGFYDRFLPRCTHGVRIAVAFECQRLPHLTGQTPLDVIPDMIVTEKKIYHP
jgi:5-formyltetrahydrofolate cyclo-ligase